MDAYEVALSLMDSELRAGNGLAAAKLVALRLTKNQDAVERAAAGGAVFEAVFPLLNPFARIPVCGLISMCNATSPSPGPILVPQLMRAILTKRLTFHGVHRFRLFCALCGFLARCLGPRGANQISRRIASALRAACRCKCRIGCLLSSTADARS